MRQWHERPADHDEAFARDLSMIVNGLRSELAATG
jgi:hypothetical protein